MPPPSSPTAKQGTQRTFQTAGGTSTSVDDFFDDSSSANNNDTDESLLSFEDMAGSLKKVVELESHLAQFKIAETLGITDSAELIGTMQRAQMKCEKLEERNSKLNMQLDKLSKEVDFMSMERDAERTGKKTGVDASTEIADDEFDLVGGGGRGARRGGGAAEVEVQTDRSQLGATADVETETEIVLTDHIAVVRKKNEHQQQQQQQPQQSAPTSHKQDEEAPSPSSTAEKDAGKKHSPIDPKLSSASGNKEHGKKKGGGKPGSPSSSSSPSSTPKDASSLAATSTSDTAAAVVTASSSQQQDTDNNHSADDDSPNQGFASLANTTTTIMDEAQFLQMHKPQMADAETQMEQIEMLHAEIMVLPDIMHQEVTAFPDMVDEETQDDFYKTELESRDKAFAAAKNYARTVREDGRVDVEDEIDLTAADLIRRHGCSEESPIETDLFAPEELGEAILMRLTGCDGEEPRVTEFWYPGEDSHPDDTFDGEGDALDPVVPDVAKQQLEHPCPTREGRGSKMRTTRIGFSDRQVDEQNRVCDPDEQVQVIKLHGCSGEDVRSPDVDEGENVDVSKLKLVPIPNECNGEEDRSLESAEVLDRVRFTLAQPEEPRQFDHGQGDTSEELRPMFLLADEASRDFFDPDELMDPPTPTPVPTPTSTPTPSAPASAADSGRGGGRTAAAAPTEHKEVQCELGFVMSSKPPAVAAAAAAGRERSSPSPPSSADAAASSDHQHSSPVDSSLASPPPDPNLLLLGTEVDINEKLRLDAFTGITLGTQTKAQHWDRSSDDEYSEAEEDDEGTKKMSIRQALQTLRDAFSHLLDTQSAKQQRAARRGGAEPVEVASPFLSPTTKPGAEREETEGDITSPTATATTTQATSETTTAVSLFHKAAENRQLVLTRSQAKNVTTRRGVEALNEVATKLDAALSSAAHGVVLPAVEFLQSAIDATSSADDALADFSTDTRWKTRAASTRNLAGAPREYNLLLKAKRNRRVAEAEVKCWDAIGQINDTVTKVSKELTSLTELSGSTNAPLSPMQQQQQQHTLPSSVSSPLLPPVNTKRGPMMMTMTRDDTGVSPTNFPSTITAADNNFAKTLPPSSFSKDLLPRGSRLSSPDVETRHHASTPASRSVPADQAPLSPEAAAATTATTTSPHQQRQQHNLSSTTTDAMFQIRREKTRRMMMDRSRSPNARLFVPLALTSTATNANARQAATAAAAAAAATTAWPSTPQPVSRSEKNRTENVDSRKNMARSSPASSSSLSRSEASQIGMAMVGMSAQRHIEQSLPSVAVSPQAAREMRAAVRSRLQQ